MASRRVTPNNSKKETPKHRPPAKSPQARERQLISHAVDLAEEQILSGTASAQVITHYLKLGSSREHLEQERLSEEVKLLKIKAETLESQKRVEELYVSAMDAFRNYSGQESADEDDADIY